MRIRWFATDLPFIEGVSLINNRIFDAENWLERPIGEVPLWRQQWKQKPYWKMPAGLTGKHQCHPEWIATGEPWPVTLPATAYNPNWIPTCCGLHQQPTALPINVGFRIGVHYYLPRSVRLPINVLFRIGVRYTAPIVVRIPATVNFRIGVTYTRPAAVAIPVTVGFNVGVSYTAPSGTWLRDVHGDYTFTAAYTGDHRLRLIGAGGRGADATVAGGMDLGAGGGGGGAESDSVLALVSGTGYTVHVGEGGHVTADDGEDTRIKDGPTVLVLAAGGKGAVDQTGGPGGAAVDCVGDVAWSGGTGADSNVDLGGGGGGSSGCYSPTGMPPGTGTDGAGQIGGVPPLPDGGPGGDGGDPLAGGSAGGYSGGGGGGAGAGAADPGGDGHDGRIVIDWPA